MLYNKSTTLANLGLINFILRNKQMDKMQRVKISL